jgi:outer membrane lipoprotein-sorting protein
MKICHVSSVLPLRNNYLRMKAILLAVILLCTVSTYAQNYGNKINPSHGFSERLKVASEKTQSITCDFDQVKYMSVLAKTNKSKGKFFYKKDQKICLEYTNPQGNLIVMNGGKFKIQVGGKTTIVRMNSNPMMRQMGNMLGACMTGNLNLFGAESLSEYYENQSYYTVVIVPTNRRVKAYLKQIVLRFEKSDMTLCVMKMSENETDYTQYEFSDKKLNATIDEDRFKI